MNIFSINHHGQRIAIDADLIIIKILMHSNNKRASNINVMKSLSLDNTHHAFVNRTHIIIVLC